MLFSGVLCWEGARIRGENRIQGLVQTVWSENVGFVGCHRPINMSCIREENMIIYVSFCMDAKFYMVVDASHTVLNSDSMQ